MSRIYSRASWGARYRDGVGSRPVGHLEKYLHHSVTRHLPESASIAQERVECRTVERIGQQRFGAGISYTFLVFPSGRIHQGASVGRISYHSGGAPDGKPRNTLGVGICLIGNYQANKPTAAQLSALVWLLQEGVRRGWWNDPAITEGHRDFKATSCPGQYAYAQIGNVNKRGRGDKVTTPSKPKPKPKPSTGGGSKVTDTDPTAGNAHEWPWHKLREDGDDGRITYRAYQRLLAPRTVGNYRGIIDGDFATLSVKAEQRWLKKLGYYRGRIDGKRQVLTIKAAQAFLYDKGHYRNGNYSKSVMVDGDWSGRSVIGLQRYLNAQQKFYR